MTKTSRSVRSIFEDLGLRLHGAEIKVESLPFSESDITAGSESELQAVVVGAKESVDLPLQIERSNYYANISRRIAAGDTPRRAIIGLERYLNDNREQVWENSWARFPMRLLSAFGRQTFQSDMLADKRDHRRGLRADMDRFIVREGGETLMRVPVSYLLKLALAEIVGSQPDLPRVISVTGVKLLEHFLNDNTSPETFSFYVTLLRPENGLGRELAREKAKRFLLSQLLLMYANRRLGLLQSGQRAMIYFAPHPPVRQKQLNDCISDAFYRELFISPCLSGWDDGEAKHAYMKLCHQVLSRSQLNAVAKLREAGIVVNNLVVLPNLSNISLANNGAHISLGSRMLTAAMRAGHPGFGPVEEKFLGDLTIKIVEHFLPLFVGSYSAAPYRLDFADFHPEKVLGFLPHELDYTHLRMIWRRWRRKADLKIFGCAMTPCGPSWIDRLLSALFRLKGDWVADFRLLDYLVAVMSTESSPALDGSLGAGDRLKLDLADLGVFDTKMPLYLLYRLREFEVMGFTGFEGRYYSLFESLTEDVGRAADLQALLTALAFKYQAQGKFTHVDIPDKPFVESERRQIFFGAAIGLPTFFVRRDTPNQLLRAILSRTKRTRASRRYSGYLRVQIDDYRQALLQTLLEDGADLIEMFRMRETIADLKARLDDAANAGAAGKLARGILESAGESAGLRSPMRMKAEEFNLQAERYYRDTLRRRHIAEAFEFLIDDLRVVEKRAAQDAGDARNALRDCLNGRGAAKTAERLRPRIVADDATEDELRELINLTLLSIHQDMEESRKWITAQTGDASSERGAKRGERRHERMMDARANALDTTPVY
jgi:hypothetical protein